MKPTKEQVSALLSEAYSVHTSDLSSSIELAAKALSRSKQLKDKALIAQSLNQLSLFYMTSGDYEQAAAHSGEAVIYFQELEEEKRLAQVSENINEEQDLTELHGKKVLLAEDNQLNAVFVIELLKKYGMETEHVGNGKLAYHSARLKKFDFILMDIHMPELNGIEAAKLIRSKHNFNKDIPIFALTADIMINNDSDYMPLFNAFLYKPLDIEELAEVLSKVKK